MPSLEALQAYNQYLTTYGKKSTSKQDLHDKRKLKDICGSIQHKNTFAPVYLNEPTSKEILDTLTLKEQVYSYHQDIARLYANHPDDPFMQKIPYCDHNELCEISLSNHESTKSLPQTLNIEVNRFACAQTNVGSLLPADQKVDLPNGNYSFDLEIKNLRYELQFDIYPDDTNSVLQNRISNLVNKSNLGLHSAVLSDGKASSLCFVSDAIGKPLSKELHFEVTDDQTSQTAGVIDYLGINQNIKPPQNALIQCGDTPLESYDNHFVLFDNYELQFTPPAEGVFLPISIEIGFYPDVESLTRNIEAFVDGYNQLHEDITQSGASNVLPELGRIILAHRDELSAFGIQKDFDGKLHFNAPEEWNQTDPKVADTSCLTEIGKQISKKLLDVSVDPMIHINRKVGIYPNPEEKPELIRPYVDFYSGLIFHKSV